MKPPESVPPESEQEAEVKRPDGVDVMVHMAPRKFEPEAVTGIPDGPEIGLNVSVGAKGATNLACPASPLVPVTKTV